MADAPPVTQTTDVVIIGAGPVGLFAVFECGMLGLKCHVVDALEAVGGQCAALYPEKPIYDIPGYPEIGAGDLIGKLAAQAAPFSPRYHLDAQVTGLEKMDGGWRVTAAAGTVIEAGAVIIAAGAGAFGPNRPPMEGLETFEGMGPGRGVNYLVNKREDYAGKRIVIAGGGDSAVDWALALAENAESLAVVHRRPRFRAAPESVERMKALEAGGGLELVIPYQLAALDGGGGALDAVIVRDLDGGERRLEADVLLPFFGLSQNLGPILEWDLPLEKNRVAVDPATMGTAQAGLFGIGDIVDYPGKLKLILTGFAEAALAAHGCRGVCRPDETPRFEYSTTKGVPGS